MSGREDLRRGRLPGCTCRDLFRGTAPFWGPVAAARIAARRAAGDDMAVSDLVRMECLVGPLKTSNPALFAAFAAFFGSPDVRVVPITPTVCDRAARIRAEHNFKPLDSLHLAAAVEHGCGLFMTNDARLARFGDIPWRS